MSGVRASFGGMLLLIAIHFHSNQMMAISDLVSSTLGMKVTTHDLHFFSTFNDVALLQTCAFSLTKCTF